ncbi:MAG: ABC transporter ATP-binding protein, partial [Armatimonadota bacterium]
MTAGKHLWSYLKPRWPTLLLAFIFLVGRSVATLWAVRQTEPILDSMGRGGAGSLRAPLPSIPDAGDAVDADSPLPGPDALRHSALNLLCAYLTRILLGLGGVLLIAYVGLRTVADMRRRAFLHIQDLSLGFLEGKRSGTLVANIISDTNLISRLVGTGLLGALVSNPVIIIGGIVDMLRIDWALSLVAIGAVPIVLLVIAKGGQIVGRARAAAQRDLGRLASVVEEALHGVRTIRIFDMADAQEEKFQEQNRANARAQIRERITIGVMRSTVEIIPFLAFGVAAWFLADRMYSGPLTPGAFATFLLLMMLVGRNCRELARLNADWQAVQVALSRIQGVLDGPVATPDPPDAEPLPPVRGHIALQDVCFEYEPGDVVLDHVNLEIKPGEVVALVGPSGSGKSTIAALISRLHVAQSGRVTIDGHDVTTVTAASLRAQMAVVPQDTILFAGTVRDNILFGNPEASEVELIAAAQTAYAHDFISALPNGYDTLIGERGVKLSGGQRQRLAIARALIRSPKMLILDEATSSLDAKAEREIRQAVSTLIKDRTTLIIAHRLSTVVHADRIVVLDNGKIGAEGTHEDLLAPDGSYGRRLELQAQPR